MNKIDVETIKKEAHSDYLTGLANRRGLYEFFEHLPGDWKIHAMFIDVDNFKRVNDSYGHSMGDELLKQIANLIDSRLPGFVSRIGGDEFVGILDGGYSRQQVEELASELLLDMEQLEFRKDILSFVSLSVGIVLEQGSNTSIDDILSKCDAAMYQAKFNGKNCYAVYVPNDRSMEISKSIELEMEDALVNGEFEAYFQPKLNMVTSALCGAEALARWNHPVDGIREPEIFIPIFEKNGFIAKLDMCIFEQACKAKASWKGTKYASIPVSVNMSRFHMYNRRFPEQLEQICRKYDVATNELEIEITESVFIKDNVELIQIVNRLQEKGFLVSIDDFGSGFSALNLLKDIPVNTIKLDRNFLEISDNDVRGKKVIRGVIAMCKDLKLDVVSEGVQTREQIDFLTSCGCQIAQGFYYAHPLPIKKFELFAEEFSTNPLDHYEFRFNGNLRSEDGAFKGKIVGEGLEYVQGIYKDSKAIRFPGGDTEKNVVELPHKAIVNDSFTISAWICPRKNREWASALYVKFESGFCSIVPCSPGGYSDFRIRDSREVDGWYDVTGCQLRENEWVHYVVTYNSKIEKVVAFINGEVVGWMANVPANYYAKRIMVGGDVFQPSFVGDICEISIYNETKDYDFVKNLHHEYVMKDGFVGFN